MEIEKKVYAFKTEFWNLTGITKNQWENRREDLELWLSNFYDYTLIEGKPLRIEIKEIYGEYQPLPRKVKYTREDKIKDYEEFTIAALGSEYKFNSKTKVAKDAIDKFGYQKYKHKSSPAVVKSYVGPAMNKYGEKSSTSYWVWSDTYEPPDTDSLDRWKEILKEEKISEKEAANAFYKQASGEDIDEELNYYKKALERFKLEYGRILIRVSKWRLRS